MDSIHVFYKARGAKKPNRYVYTVGSYGTDSTCTNTTMVSEYHCSLSPLYDTCYLIVLKEIYLSLDEDTIEDLGCKSMEAGKKYRIQ